MSHEKQTAHMPQEVDKRRRRLLAGAATLAGTGAVIGAFSSVEPAYAAVKKIADFKDRRNRTSHTHSAPNHTPVTLDLSQGQPVFLIINVGSTHPYFDTLNGTQVI